MMFQFTPLTERTWKNLPLSQMNAISLKEDGSHRSFFSMNGLRVCWRLTLGLMVVASLLACSSKVEFMAAMPEPEANEVLAALQIAGISAEKMAGKEGMVGVSIDAEQVGRAVTLLREKGLPRERFAGMGQVFKKEGLISSPLEERARYLYALSQELGATLTQIDGVIVARVHVVLPERGISGEVGIPSSAAVFIKHQDGYNLDTVLPQVRRLVTNSIPGLTADKVSIVLVGAQSGRSADSAALPAGALGATAEKPMTQTGFSSPAVKGILLVIVALLLTAVAGLLAMKMGLLQRWGQKISASDSHATADKPSAAVAAASKSSSAG